MITFLSFGNGTYTRSAKRIENEARRCGWFDNIEVYNQLRLEQTEFWQNHGNFCQENPRGYGYWIWKPWLIRKTIESISDDDILVYADSGCTINTNCPKEYFDEIIKNLCETPLGIYCHELSSCQEYKYTKPETIVALAADDKLDTPQIMATILFIRKCEASLKFIDKWFEWCIKNNYIYINDLYNIQYDVPENFVDHRHDQSIFSILVKKSSYAPYIVPDNTWKNNDGSWPPNTPIWATRYRT